MRQADPAGSRSGAAHSRLLLIGLLIMAGCTQAGPTPTPSPTATSVVPSPSATATGRQPSPLPSPSPSPSPTATESARGRVLCGRLSADECLRTIRQANVTPLPDGWAVVVESSCGPGEWCDWLPSSYVVLVPPDWEEAGGLQITTVQLDLGDATRNDQLNLRPHIREMLPTDGPWTDPSVGDHLWVVYTDIGWEAVTAFVERHGLDGVNDQLNRAQPVGWFEIRTRDDTDPAALRDELLADPVICGVERVRFDEDLEPIMPAPVPGCTDRPPATPPPPAPIDPFSWSRLVWSVAPGRVFAGDRQVRVVDAIPWGDGFLAVGYEGSIYEEPPPTGVVWLSEDGASWQRVVPDAVEFDGVALTSVAQTARGFVAWDTPGTHVMFSPDGRHWLRSEYLNPMGIAQALDGSVLGWNLGNEDHTLWRSEDGSWLEGTPTVGLEGVLLNRIIDTPLGLFVFNSRDANGYNASYRSTDGGATWSRFHLPSDRAAYSVFVRPGRVYATEALPCSDCTGPFLWDPPVWWTSDGVTWTLADNDGHPNDLGVYDGRFVVHLPPTPTHGQVTRISLDGETWHTAVSELGDPSLADDPNFAYSNAVVVGSNGILAFRTDLDAAAETAVWFGRGATDP